MHIYFLLKYTVDTDDLKEQYPGVDILMVTSIPCESWCYQVYTLFPPGTIVRDSHHRKSPTRREQGLSLRRIWVQTLLNEVVQ